MKAVLLLAVLIMASSLALADIETFIPIVGDNQTYFVMGDAQYNNYFHTTTPTTNGTETEGGTGGGAGSSTLRYDVVVKVKDKTVTQGGIVRAVITLTNNGDLPDEDAVLKYYLYNPNFAIIGETQEQLLEVPPLLFDKTSCEQRGGIIQGEKCVTVLERSIELPEDMLEGYWKFYIEYDTKVQPLIKVYDSFTVKSRKWGYIPFVIIAAVIFFVIFQKKREERNIYIVDYK